MHKHYQSPTRINIHRKILKIVSGAFHSYAIATDGFYAWGKANNFNLGTNLQSEVNDIPIFTELPIENISTSASHTFAWKTNEVYGWGSNLSYELGQEEEKPYLCHKLTLYAQAIEAGLKLHQISCGENHSMSTFKGQDQQTKLFGWGQSKSHQLTLDTNSTIPYPVLSEFDLQIENLYSRSDFNIVICKEGVYGWGSNVFGRLGQGLKKIRVPVSIPVPKKIVRIGIGIYHVIGVSKDGEAFGWGSGRHGELGLGKIVNDALPQKMICSERIIDASCGETHSLVLLQNGKLMSCGNNKYKCLGHQIVDERQRALKLQMIHSDETFTSVGSGNRHNLVLNGSGKVYAWGSNQYGQVGSPYKKFMPLSNLLVEDPDQSISDSRAILLTDVKFTNPTSELITWKIKFRQFQRRKLEQEEQLMQQLERIIQGSKKSQ